MLEYSVALLNVWWSKGDKNIRFFESVEEQSTYFDKLVGGQTSPLTNFNMGNNIETAITYLDTTNKSIEELVSSNYCVIYKKENGTIIDRRYFFAYPSQDSGRQMRVLLSLDDIQTNYIKYRKSIAPCNIKRACLNRFKKIGNDNIAFNDELTDDNHLFEEENLAVFPKRITQRISITPSPDTNKSSTLTNWFRDNILGWQYIYLDDSKTYTILNVSSINTANNFQEGGITFSMSYKQKNSDLFGGRIRGATGCICVPIYKGNKEIIARFTIDEGTSENPNIVTYNTKFNSSSLNFFKLKNNDESYFYASKFSILPPFEVGDFNAYTIEDGNLIFNASTAGNSSYIEKSRITISYRDFQTLYGLFIVDAQYLNDEITESLTLPFRFGFQRGELINGVKNVAYNPKMLSSKFIEIKVTNGNGQKFSYNLQKLGTNSLTLKYKEALTPDITRSMLYFENGQYTKENAQGYLGLINSFDNSLMQSNDQLQQFLAQNKNFHLQKAVAWTSQVAKSGIGAGVTMAGGGKNALASAEGGLASTFIDILSDGINTSLTLDNLENSPDMLKNANGNAIFNLMASGQNLIVEIYESLPSEKEEANDFMVQFGFTYNHIDKLANVDNIRKRFNYIEAEIDTIDAPISNIEKERLKDILKSIRFWNSDKVDYHLENYERWLEKYE